MGPVTGISGATCINGIVAGAVVSDTPCVSGEACLSDISLLLLVLLVNNITGVTGISGITSKPAFLKAVRLLSSHNTIHP